MTGAKTLQALEGRRGQALIAAASCLLVAGGWLVVGHPAVALVLALLPVAAIAVLRWPYPVVLMFVVFSFFRLHEAFPALYSLRIPQLLALGALAALAWNILSGRIRPYWTRELALFSVFLVLVVVSTLMATNRGVAMEHLTGVFMKIAVMVFAIPWLLTGRRELALTSRILVLAGIAIAAVTLLNKVNGVGLVEGTRVTIGRDIGSMLGDPNDLALVLLFPAGFALALGATKGVDRPTRLLGWIAYLAFAAAIVATQSRGGLLGMAAVTGVFVARRIRSKAVLAALGVVGLLVLFAVAGVGDRQSGGAHEEGLDESAKGRLYAWEAAVRMAVHNPLSGVGMMNYYYNYYQYSDWWDGKNYNVHSTWFGVLAETGFLGFILFAALVAVALRNARRLVHDLAPKAGAPPADPESYAIAQAVLSGLVGFAVAGTFLSMGFVWPFYIIFAVTVGVVHRVNRLALAP